MPGPKPRITWEPQAIIDWYELETKWCYLEGKKTAVLWGAMGAFLLFILGILIGTTMGYGARCS